MNSGIHVPKYRFRRGPGVALGVAMLFVYTCGYVTLDQYRFVAWWSTVLLGAAGLLGAGAASPRAFWRTQVKDGTKSPREPDLRRLLTRLAAAFVVSAVIAYASGWSTRAGLPPAVAITLFVGAFIPIYGTIIYFLYSNLRVAVHGAVHAGGRTLDLFRASIIVVIIVLVVLGTAFDVLGTKYETWRELADATGSLFG